MKIKTTFLRFLDDIRLTTLKKYRIYFVYYRSFECLFGIKGEGKGGDKLKNISKNALKVATNITLGY